MVHTQPTGRAYGLPYAYTRHSMALIFSLATVCLAIQVSFDIAT